MELVQRFGAITSSTNPEDIAMRVKGITLALSSVIILVAGQLFHVTLSANDVISLATELGAVAGAITTLYGVGIYILAKIFKRPTV